MASYALQDMSLRDLGTLKKLRGWDPEIPRFLFRGFTKDSGGNEELNKPTAITPHAFLDKFVDTENDQSVGSGADAMSSSGRKFYPSPTALDAMSLAGFRTEINRHLNGNRDMVSHFSSWTADFDTARRFALAPEEAGTRYIGIFDTSRRNDANVILHVRALRKEGHTFFKYDCEYLVYGPVTGLPYTCLDLFHDQSIPLNPSSYPPPYSHWSGWPGFRRLECLSRIRYAYNRAAKRSFYHAAGTEHEARWGPCMDTALYLTIIAVEWSQDTAIHEDNWSLVMISNNHKTKKRWQAMVTDVSRVIEWAARDATLLLPLVNPRTHQNACGLPRLSLMLNILQHFEAEIIRLRSNPQPAPSPEPWFLTRFLWGQT